MEELRIMDTSRGYRGVHKSRTLEGLDRHRSQRVTSSDFLTGEFPMNPEKDLIKYGAEGGSRIF